MCVLIEYLFGRIVRILIAAIIICGSSVDSVATKSFVKQFAHPPRNHTKVMILDAGNQVFHDPSLCTRVWPPSSISINTTASSLSGFNMLTILSTNFAKYLKLVINQGPIRADNATTTGRLAQMENQIKSSVDGSAIELMPEIMSKIKHFYSTSAKNASGNANTDNVLDYCQQFLANNFQLDANTTAYVCANLLHDEDVNESPQVQRVGQRDDNKDANVVTSESATSSATTTTSVDRSRCPVVVEWYALFDFIILTATIVGSSGKPGRVQLTVVDGDGVGGNDADDDDDGAGFEYNLFEYDTDLDGFAWPPVLRLKPFQLRSVGGGEGGVDEAEILSASSSIGRFYAEWVSGGLNMFWQCGMHCWTVTLLIGLMFLMSVFGSIVAGIAIR